MRPLKSGTYTLLKGWRFFRRSLFIYVCACTSILWQIAGGLAHCYLSRMSLLVNIHINNIAVAASVATPFSLVWQSSSVTEPFLQHCKTAICVYQLKFLSRYCECQSDGQCGRDSNGNWDATQLLWWVLRQVLLCGYEQSPTTTETAQRERTVVGSSRRMIQSALFQNLVYLEGSYWAS